MPRRLAGKLITSPLAFLLGGVIELLAFAGSALYERARASRRSVAVSTMAGDESHSLP